MAKNGIDFHQRLYKHTHIISKLYYQIVYTTYIVHFIVFTATSTFPRRMIRNKKKLPRENKHCGVSYLKA